MAKEKLRSKDRDTGTGVGNYTWPQVGVGRGLGDGRERPTPRSAELRASAIRLAGGLVVAGILWVLDLRLGAALVVGAVLVLSLVSIAYPAAGTAIDAGIAKVVAPIGISVSTFLLAIVYFLVITPASLFLRLFRRDLLTSPGTSSASTWAIRPPESNLAMVRRQFTVEPRVSGAKPQRSVHGARFLAVSMVRAAALLVAVDLIVGTAFMHARTAPEVRYYNAKASSAALMDDKWAADYFREFRTLRSDWVPLLGTVREDHKGKYFNITNRARTTYVAEGLGDDATSVYFFGGSTTWGHGQRDLYTIPSYVARRAEEDGIPVRVTNYGQGGWVIWQELALLQQLLSEGNVPDVAVFYNGYNDVAQQVQELTTDPSYLRAKLVKEAVDRERERGSFSGLMSSFKSLYAPPPAEGQFGRPRSMLAQIGFRFSSRRSGPAPNLELTEARARNAVTLHNRAVGIIERLAKSYGFEAVFIWQPSVYTTEGGDAAKFARWSREGLGRAYLNATELVGPPLIDLADSLDGVKEAVFFDQVHTNELGAEIVAQAIYPHLRLRR